MSHELEQTEKLKKANLLDMDDETFKNTLNEYSKQSKRNIRLLITFFLIGVGIMAYIFYTFPMLSEREKTKLLRFPRTPEQLRELVAVVKEYTNSHFYHVLAFFITLYLFMQTFAIPGPLILSIVSGALFGKFYGFILVCVVSTFGASGCYLLSSSFAKYFVFKFFSKRIIQFKHSIEQNKDNLFFYMLFLRITPLLPNWLLNLSSPVVGVPYTHFILATFLGLMPANIMHVNMGAEIATMKQIGFDFKIVLFLLLLGFFALIPVWVKKYFSKYFKTEDLNKVDKENKKNNENTENTENKENTENGKKKLN